tara:strand:- start:607 stop:1926 length:1320 start_codon:yes stop_codon:yes gene_type:complete
MDYKYIFFAPFYQSHSNGIKCFWETALNFSKYKDVTILQFYNGVDSDKIPKKFENIKIINQINEIKLLSNHIVVYPDCVSSNPLEHHNVSRYLMCKPFILNGQGIEINKHDYCFSYSNAVSTIYDQYTHVSNDLLNLKQKENKIRDNTVLIYYGKLRYGLNFKGLNQLTKNFNEVKIITRMYPSNKENLYQMISESRLLISLDPLTSLIHESTLLGTPVYIYDSTFKEMYDNFNFKLHGVYYNIKEKDLCQIYRDSENLAEKAKNEIKEFKKNDDTNTLQLIQNMEDHFSKNKHHLEKYTNQLEEDINFYKNIFKCIPIFNIGTERNIIRYHMINKYKIISILIFFIFRLLRIFKKILLKNILRNIKGIFTPEEISILRKLIKNNKNYLSFLETKYNISEHKKIFYSKSEKKNDKIPNHDTSTASKYSKPSIFIRYFWK